MKRRNFLLALMAAPMAAPMAATAAMITKSDDIIDEETIISADYDLTQEKTAPWSTIHEYAAIIRNDLFKQATNKGLLIGDTAQSKLPEVYSKICVLIKSRIIESDNGLQWHEDGHKRYYDTSQCKGTISIKLTKALKATKFEFI